MSGHCPSHPRGCGWCPACQRAAALAQKAWLDECERIRRAWAKAA